MSGLRFNEGKRKWGLLSWPALAELVKVLEFGAKKYASWNWSNGLSWSECFESLQRHLTAWYTGEDKDPETGLSHMAHVFCNAMFLMHFIIFRTGTDDRPVALKQGDKLDGSKQEQLKLFEARGFAHDQLARGYPVEQCGVVDVRKDVRTTVT